MKTNLTELEKNQLEHAVKVAKFKRLKLTVGNVISLTKPDLRQRLLEAYRGKTKQKIPKEWRELQ